MRTRGAHGLMGIAAEGASLRRSPRLPAAEEELVPCQQGLQHHLDALAVLHISEASLHIAVCWLVHPLAQDTRHSVNCLCPQAIGCVCIYLFIS